MNTATLGRPKRWRTARFALAATIGLVGFSACATLPQTPLYTAQFGDNLVAAGFVVKVATTPPQVEMLARLPQHRFVPRYQGDVTRYVFADATLCGCLYLGDQNALDRFRTNRIVQQIYDQQQLALVSFNDALWDWAAWGSWGENYSFPFGRGW